MFLAATLLRTGWSGPTPFEPPSSSPRSGTAACESASFVRADFSHATVVGSDFSGADLSAATLSHSTWRQCSLAYATLAMAVLDGTCLAETDLSHAELSRAFLAGATLAGADLTGATLGRTVLAACADLARARGLDAVVHHGPSCLDLETLRAGLDTLTGGLSAGRGGGAGRARGPAERHGAGALGTARAVKRYANTTGACEPRMPPSSGSGWPSGERSPAAVHCPPSAPAPWAPPGRPAARSGADDPDAPRVSGGSASDRFSRRLSQRDGPAPGMFELSPPMLTQPPRGGAGVRGPESWQPPMQRRERVGAQ